MTNCAKGQIASIKGLIQSLTKAHKSLPKKAADIVTTRGASESKMPAEFTLIPAKTYLKLIF